MTSFRRALCAVVALLLLIPWTTPPSAKAEDGTCIHVDVRVSAGGELLSKGAEIAVDGGFGHAGTGQTFTFQAQLFPTAPDQCNLRSTDARSWSVSSWPCDNYPKPKPARTQSLSWSVTVPLDCQVFSSPGLLSASTTNGRASAGGDVLIYAGAPGFVLPYQHARGIFGPFAMQSDPVNSLTGALATVSTDAAAPGLGVPLAATRTYNSNDTDPGPLGPGWRPSYSDRIALDSGGARYLASDGRQIAFSRKGSGFAIEPGAARFTLARSGDGYVLTDFDQLRMRFSAAGELQSIRDRNNQGVVVTHSSGRVASVANGRRLLTYGYNEVGLISTITLTGPGVEPRVARYDYGGGRLIGVTSPGGVKTRYEYDGAGRLRSEFQGDAARAAVTTEYDQDGRVTAQTDGKGSRSTWTWEPSGIRGKSTMTDPTGGKWINEYERNWLVRQTDPTGVTVTFHYDSSGNLIRVFDALGHGARHTYDALGRVTSSADAAGNVTRRSYNATNDLAAVVDPLGRRTAFTYDARGNLLSTTYAGRASSTTYDARGLVTAARDVLGRATRFSYSSDGDLLGITDPAGRVSKYEVDGWGRSVKVTGPRGQTSTVSYSDDDQPLEQRGPLDVTTSQTYDDQGRLATSTGARGGVTRFRYDDAGQLVGVTAPSLPEATAEFDASGRVVKQIDASGRAQTFTYDAAGRTTATTFGGRTWRFAHDKAGRLVRTTLPSGKFASFTLDVRGAMTRIDYSDKTPSASFSWDAAGRGTSMTDVTGTTRFAYDVSDRLTSATRPGSSVTYQWDPAGNLLTRAAAGRTESYTWDAVNRLTSAKADGKTLATYAYDQARGSITVTRPGGLTEIHLLDRRGRETDLRLTRSGKTVRTIASSYDPADNLIRTTDSTTGKTAYTYDALDQLTATCYDADECTDDAKDYIRYAYDPVGNLTSDGITTYTWSAAGKPTTSTTGPTQTTYTHSADGRRTASTTGPTKTQYLWDPLSPQILTTTTGPGTNPTTGNPTTRYLYGAGLLAQTTARTTTDLTATPTGSVLTTGTTQTHTNPSASPAHLRPPPRSPYQRPQPRAQQPRAPRPPPPQAPRPPAPQRRSPDPHPPVPPPQPPPSPAASISPTAITS